MRLRLVIDGMQSQIDTRDPELLARWLLEQFALIDWTPATDVHADAWPSWSEMGAGRVRADWLTNSVQLSERWAVKSPEDVVKALADALARAKAGES